MKYHVKPGSETKSSCRVCEERFPCLGICYEKIPNMFFPQYRSVCPHCTLMTLPIDSTTLEIAALFECTRFGFGRRMTESN